VKGAKSKGEPRLLFTVTSPNEDGKKEIGVTGVPQLKLITLELERGKGKEQKKSTGGRG